jgi:hypothetical protein
MIKSRVIFWHNKGNRKGKKTIFACHWVTLMHGQYGSFWRVFKKKHFGPTTSPRYPTNTSSNKVPQNGKICTLKLRCAWLGWGGIHSPEITQVILWHAFDEEHRSSSVSGGPF